MPGYRAGNFQPKQAAADTNHVGGVVKNPDNFIGILEGAQGHHPRQLSACDWWHERAGTIGENQFFVFKNTLVVERDLFGFGVNVVDMGAHYDVYMVFQIPFALMQTEFVSANFTCQIAGKAHPKIG